MKNEESEIQHLEVLPEHESGVRRLVSDAQGMPYYPLQSLGEAKSFPDGIAILESDDGGQIYLICPAFLVKCSEEALNILLRDLDKIAWPHNDYNSAKVCYERKPAGSPVFGGMGGAVVGDDLWIHREFVNAKLDKKIRDVIDGQRLCLNDAA